MTTRERTLALINAFTDEPQLIREIATWCITANAYDTIDGDEAQDTYLHGCLASAVARSNGRRDYAWPQTRPCRGRGCKEPNRSRNEEKLKRRN